VNADAVAMSYLILNFHGVGPIPKPLDEEEHECWLDFDAFERVLDLVVGHEHVKLTIDDGNLSDVTHVLPALLRRKLRATFFVCSGRLDQPSFLSTRDMKSLVDAGMEIGSHGIAHIPWRRLPPQDLARELGESKAVLERLAARPVTSAACPLGAYDRAVVRAARHAGYRALYTSDTGKCRENDWIRARKTVTRTFPLAEARRLIAHGPTLWEQTAINVRKLIKRLR
jgi:peptidoglycan/xylan/chitin deacetylase (PgdA/CDA1 family)